MAVLGKRVGIALIVVIAMGAISSETRAVDFEKDLKYDLACVVKAISSRGDVYLQCKGSNNVLKTSVLVPSVAEAMALQQTGGFGYKKSVKDQIEFAKKLAQAKMVWGILDFSFVTQLYVLLTFNKDKTLIEDAVAYTQPDFEKHSDRKGAVSL